MKKLTLVDLATILGLDETIKKDLADNFSNYNEELKFQTAKILWDGYFELKDKLIKLKYEKLLKEVDDGKRELTSDLYDLAKKKVYGYFEDVLSGKAKEVEQIDQIRNKLQELTGTLDPQTP